MQQTRKFLPASAPVQGDGWLSPDGVFYPCGYGRHLEAAWEIAGVGGFDLEKRGWLHVSDGDIWGESRPTQVQMNALFDMQMVNPDSSLGRSIARYLGEQE